MKSKSRSATSNASALIIAGGSGTRFWPASRRHHPKPLFSLDGKSTLIEDTVRRLQPLVPLERVFVLVAATHQAPFKRALKGIIPARNVIVEPDARGTAVAIAYGAAVIRRRLGDGEIAIMWADHLIQPAAGFRRTMAAAIRLARTCEAIVAIGVTPTRPETGYGYQEIGARADGGYRVARFVEKPDAVAAKRMVESGKYLWNAGIFAMSTKTLAAELDAHAPALARAAERLAKARAAELARGYRRLNFESFDRVVVERSKKVLGVRAQFQWHDVGSWLGLWEAMGGVGGSHIRGNVVALDSDRVLAHSPDRLVALFGVSDLVVVDTGDAILIAHRDKSHDVRPLIDEIRRRGMHRYL
ncbi:MAG: mannose-1-phosphate guanylyltransferase [Candidatus Binataceae bacterium]